MFTFPLLAPRRVQRTSVQSTDVATTSHSYSNVPIGSPSSDRLIVLAITMGAAGSGVISSITVNGVAASTAAIGISNASGHIHLYQAAVSSGSSVTIAITSSASVTMRVVVFALYGLASTTPTATLRTSTTSATSLSGTIDTPSRGVLIAHGLTASSSPPQPTFTGVSRELTYSALGTTQYRFDGHEPQTGVETARGVAVSGAASGSVILLLGAVWA